jgi:hypothetical protein
MNRTNMMCITNRDGMLGLERWHALPVKMLAMLSHVDADIFAVCVLVLMLLLMVAVGAHA